MMTTGTIWRGMPADAIDALLRQGTSLSNTDRSEVRDDEHSSPSLRDAEKLGVEDSERDSSPAVP